MSEAAKLGEPVAKTEATRKYQYRDLPANLGDDDVVCIISGVDLVTGGSGCLEWCPNEIDAAERLQLMRDSGEFEHLKVRTVSEWVM